MNTPTQSLTELHQLSRHLKNLHRILAAQISGIEAEWERLPTLEQADDVAAILLAKLRPQLREISRYAKACERQIDDMVANPYKHA